VDDDWPEPGSSFHHTVGVGPIVVRDKTTVVRVDAPHEIRLRAGLGPLGAAIVRFTLSARDGATCVEFAEEPEHGAVRLAWRSLGRPLMRLGLWGRNAASLERLSHHLEERPGRHRDEEPRDQPDLRS
jgi:hypothetical protein